MKNDRFVQGTTEVTKNTKNLMYYAIKSFYTNINYTKSFFKYIYFNKQFMNSYCSSFGAAFNIALLSVVGNIFIFSIFSTERLRRILRSCSHRHFHWQIRAPIINFHFTFISKVILPAILWHVGKLFRYSWSRLKGVIDIKSVLDNRYDEKNKIILYVVMHLNGAVQIQKRQKVW